MTAKLLSSKILTHFPRKYAFAFAYGSGVKQQTGYSEATLSHTLIDLVFCVENSCQWHQQNIQINPSHYSLMRYLGPPAITKYQTDYGAKMYCNTLVPLDDNIMVKYGVISVDDLRNDLNKWTDLYVAGRLHKPVSVLIEPNDPGIQSAIDNNFKSAIRVALLLLPHHFTFYEFFYEIARISYRGDFRMIFGENKNKVQNIVEPQLDEFIRLYAPQLKQFEHCLHISNGGRDAKIEQCKLSQTVRDHLTQLPANVAKRMDMSLREGAMERQLRKSLALIVCRSSITQSMKNIPTAGLLKSIKYGWKKAMKTFS